MEEHVVEACHACNIKVRILKEKVPHARCPQCKGPIGDPKLDHPCPSCGAVNRVMRSKLLAARCGRCKEALVAGEAAPRELILAEAQSLVRQVFAEPRLASRRTQPRDLVEVVDLLKAMPQAIVELAASQPLGAERDRLSAMSQRCRQLVPQLRPYAFEQPAVLLDDAFVQHYALADAFEVMRRHPLAWESLRLIRRQDRGMAAARQELLPAGDVFERVLGRLHKTDYADMDGDRARRTKLAEKVLFELAKQIDTWAIRPIKLEGLVMGAMSRLKELAGGGDAFATQEAELREEVTAMLAIATVVVARGHVHHQIGSSLRETWQGLFPALRGQVMAAV